MSGSLLAPIRVIAIALSQADAEIHDGPQLPGATIADLVGGDVLEILPVVVSVGAVEAVDYRLSLAGRLGGLGDDADATGDAALGAGRDGRGTLSVGCGPHIILWLADCLLLFLEQAQTNGREG